MAVDEDSLPRFAVLSPEHLKLYEAATAKGVYNLTTAERDWRDRRETLVARGYELRPRYHPGWTPSWLGTRRDPTFCEDSILIEDYHIIDAIRIHDARLVAIKDVENNKLEIELARALTTGDLLADPTNHCIPMLDSFPDPLNENSQLMVMPYLCPFDDPPFNAVGEVLDFVQQTLEGLLFLHKQGVAHRDCASANIMMDGAPLYPRGHHPIRREFLPDAVHLISPLPRIDNPVRYYFIDFGMSTRFEPGASHLVTGAKGRDKELPELSRDVPYDAFKADVFILGNVYKKEFLEKYHGLDCLSPLVTAMTKEDPEKRPTVQFALAFFHAMVESRNTPNPRWRLRPREESVPERVVYDTVAMARETFYHLKRIVG
ncbi:hypothetical protein EVG20_g7709 [Dentipellis fragilis]|uniref:Protein kinase domain-containing protein n=1 Tax=Dentipellis fragilis TaxID=205917 RepID=A0A4Y9YAX2_9AGAM|nr:hypothetical protein EVG20_g7709 [Dentipellis fragilis]